MPSALATRLSQALLLGGLSGLVPSGLVPSGLLPFSGGITAEAAEWIPELAPGQTASLGPQDNGGRVNLRRGDQLRLVLPGNAGTGYRWVIESIDRRQLQLVGAELWSDPGPLAGPGRRPGLVGGPQQTTFLFRAVGSGASELRLKYWPGPARAGAGDPGFRVRVESGIP